MSNINPEAFNSEVQGQANQTTVISDTGSGILVGTDPAQPPATSVPEATAPEAPSSGNERTFTEADLNRARQQEKDKLYPQLDALKTQVESLTKDRQDQEAARAAQAQADADEARRKAEEEMDLRELFNQKQAEWESQLQAERQQREQAFALMDKEREFQAVRDYQSQAMAAAGDSIMPHLTNLVGGNTQEEIDASIANAQQLTSAILTDVQAQMQAQRQAAPGTRVTSPPVGAMESYGTQDQQISDQDISNMSMADYAKLRSRLGIGAPSSSRGMF